MVSTSTLALFVGVFGDLEIVQGDCAVIVEAFGAIELGIG